MSTYTTKVSRAFKDISLSFKKHPVTNDVTVLRNEDAIKKSVINLTRTRINERFFNDLLGTSVADNLFENMGSGLETALEEEISTLLGNYEPRIELNSVYVIADQDSNELSIQVDYNIVGLPIPSQTIEFLLQPTRV
jgi:phage baseplate assembly protein W|tara:strand:+ start:346 stop:756 length:411 start_codon:yes stop_codon:yes gene_type:complete